MSKEVNEVKEMLKPINIDPKLGATSDNSKLFIGQISHMMSDNQDLTNKMQNLRLKGGGDELRGVTDWLAQKCFAHIVQLTQAQLFSLYECVCRILIVREVTFAQIANPNQANALTFSVDKFDGNKVFDCYAQPVVLNGPREGSIFLEIRCGIPGPNNKHPQVNNDIKKIQDYVKNQWRDEKDFSEKDVGTKQLMVTAMAIAGYKGLIVSAMPNLGGSVDSPYIIKPKRDNKSADTGGRHGEVICLLATIEFLKSYNINWEERKLFFAVLAKGMTNNMPCEGCENEIGGLPYNIGEASKLRHLIVGPDTVQLRALGL
jgi:hypothetical protein